MNHCVVFYSLTLTVLFLGQVSVAQEQQRNVLGVGMSIEPALFGGSLIYYTSPYGPEGFYFLDQQAYATSPLNIYIPIRVSPSFRIEPVFGLYTFRNEETTTNPVSTPAVSNYKVEATLTHIGIGGFYLIPTSNSLQMYVGPRIGINFVSTLSASPYYNGSTQLQREVETKETDFSVGLSFGAEYFPISEISVGAEVSGNYVSFGNPEVTRTPTLSSSSSTIERNRHIITTNALFFLRWYFVKGTSEE